MCSHDEERSLHWYCKTCTSILRNLLSTVSRIDQAQQRLESKLDYFIANSESKSNINELVEFSQNKLEVKVNELSHQLHAHVNSTQNKLEDRVQELSHQLKAQATNTRLVRNTVEDAVKLKLQEDKEEEEEISKRKCSVIVHGLPEPSAESSESRLNLDNEMVENLLHKIDLDSVSVDKITRLGKLVDGQDAKPRPVKLTIASEAQKEQVLKQAKNLRKIQEGGMQNVFIHQDLTPLQRQRKKRKLLVQELRRRQADGEQNLILVNWKIVTRNLHTSGQQVTVATTSN